MSDAFPPPPPPVSGAMPAPGGGWVQPGSTVRHAGFWKRFAAMLIDGLVVAIPTNIISSAAFGAVPSETVSCNGGFAICEQPTGVGFLMFLVIFLASFGAGVTYYAYLDGKTGQTLGKRALSIKVVDADTGELIGGGRGVGRYFAKILSGIAFALGYLWMLWDPKKQTWHDKMVRSVVVEA